MLSSSETSVQITNALEKLIDSGISLGERVLGALIIFIVGKFLVNWLNRLFARILEKRKVDPSIQSFLKSMVNILLHHRGEHLQRQHVVATDGEGHQGERYMKGCGGCLP